MDEDDDEDYDSDDTWESDLDSEAEIAEIMQLDIAEDTSNTGKKEYLSKCSELKIVPIAMFIAKLDCEHINLRHHGMGVKGALAISSALLVNSQIRSLNLGDNWLRDDGTHALAQVFSTNTALTSINLSDNRIGLPGVISLCQHLGENSTLAELSLKDNALTDRAAKELAEAFKQSGSLTKIDLSYNEFTEEAGKFFGDMLNGHSLLLDVNLKWNNLKAKGGRDVAAGLSSNQVLNRIDLGWNGLGDDGIKHVSEMLKQNAALTHLDISHNRVNPAGCLALAEGIKTNQNLLSLEMGFNPMGVTAAMNGTLQHDPTGIVSLIDALRNSESIEQVGLSNVQSGGSYARGRASRFDPKNPDGHYALDLQQPWDRFIAETLHERMINEKGESWINVGLNAHALDVSPDGWTLPPKGTLEFDYVTWKRGLEASFRLDLANPCDLFLGERLLARVQAAEAAGDAEGAEELRECKLNDEPLDPSTALPSQGILQVVYFSTLQQDVITFDISLELSQPNDVEICRRLWERALTTPTDDWAAATLEGQPTSFDTWQYPHVPDAGKLALTYAVRLAIKPYDRGVFFSPPIANAPFVRILATLEGTLPGPEPRAPRPGVGPPPGDFDKVNLMRQAAARNYFTSSQVKTLVDLVSYRKNKIETAVLLHPRTTDQANFVHSLKSLSSETDRQDILEMVGASVKRRTAALQQGFKQATKETAKASAATGLLSSMAAASAASRPPAAAAPAGAS